MSYGFCNKFIRFQQCKNFENRFDKVTISLNVGTFFETVYTVLHKTSSSSVKQKAAILE